MKIVDLNLLIYAVNRDAPHHGLALQWWEKCLADTETVGLPWLVILGFLRIMTNGRIMPNPLSSEQALDIVNEWLKCPIVRIISPTERHWSIFRQIIRPLGTAGNLTTDAHLAALAVIARTEIAKNCCLPKTEDQSVKRLAGAWDPLGENLTRPVSGIAKE